jgi:phosphate starvation-inducible protein PhoH
MFKLLIILFFAINISAFVRENFNYLTYSSITLCSKKKDTNNEIYIPKNLKQHEYSRYLSDDKIKLIFSIGPAGTGKTLFACQKAIIDLKNNNIDKIILTRPIVTLEEDIGFLPGVLNKKMEPWVRPFLDIFEEYYSPNELNTLIFNNKIEISPLLFMRGRTFKNCIVIADEMQNSSPNQMKMLLTRIGPGCKMLITGDPAQSDIIKENGLNDFIKKYNLYNNSEKNSGIKIVNFNNEHVERSKIVSNILNIYNGII